MSKHRKTKIVYRSKPQIDTSIATKREMEEIKAAKIREAERTEREMQGKGRFGRFWTRAAGAVTQHNLNRELAMRNQHLRDVATTRSLKARTEAIRARVELEEARSKLAEKKKVNNITWESLTSGIKV